MIYIDISTDTRGSQWGIALVSRLQKKKSHLVSERLEKINSVSKQQKVRLAS